MSQNADLESGDAQNAYYDKLFQKQVRKIPSFLRVPSQEVLFAKERKYYPEKVKIMMTKSNIQHRDAKKVFGPHDFGIDSPYRRQGPSRFMIDAKSVDQRIFKKPMQQRSMSKIS